MVEVEGRDTAGGPAESPTAPDAGRILLVPRAPGPLSPVGPEPHVEDELDQLVDEMFGEGPSEGPGWFDIGLIAVGAALSAIGYLGGGPWLVVGIALLLLGLALPLRSLLRRYRSRRTSRAVRVAASKGYVLDGASPATRRLASAYAALCEAAAGSRSVVSDQAVEAAHGAVVEVATLLEGRPPITDTQVAYVDRRTEAIRATTGRLRRVRHVAQLHEREGTDAAFDAERADLRTQAREELESAAGMSSVDQLAAVQDLLRREGGHGSD